MRKTATGTQVTLYNRIERCDICGNPIGGVTGRAEAYRLRLVVGGKRRTLFMHLSCGDRFIVGKVEGGADMTRKEIEAVVAGAKQAPEPEPERVRDLEARLAELRAAKQR